MRMNDALAALAAVAVAAAEVSAAAVPLDPAPIVSVGLYKNGMAVVTRRITPGEDGVSFVDANARPAYGSFWLVSGGGVSVSSTKADVLRENVDAGFAEGWTGAYDGRKIEVAFRCGVGMDQILDAAAKTGSMKVLAGTAGESSRICTVRGTAVKDESERAAEPIGRRNMYYGYASYYYEPPKPKPAKSLNVRLESGSIVSVPESAVVSVRSDDGDSRGIARAMPVWRFDGAKAPFDVQYIATGACWTPSYRVDLADGKGTVSMTAEVYNDIADWKDAEVSLISGFPNLLYADVPSLLGGGVDFGAYSSAIRAAEDDTYWGWFRRGGRNRGGVMSQSVMLNSSFTPSGGADSFSAGAAESAGAGTDIHYRGVGRMTLARGDRRMLQLGRKEVALRRIVEWNLSDDRDERGNLRDGTEEERRTAWDAVVFANPFGFPMTTAPVEIAEGGRVLGQSKIGWTNPGDEASVKITKALTVSVKYTESLSGMDGVKRWGGRDWRKEGVKGSFSIRNHRGEPATVRVKKTVSGELVDATDAKVHDRPAQPENPNLEHDMTWEFVLAPGEDKVFSIEYWHWLWR